MNHSRNRKLFSAALLVSGWALSSFSLNADADEASCVSFIDYMKQGYQVRMDSLDLYHVEKYAVRTRERSIEFLNPKLRFYIPILQHLNGNTLSCGRDVEVMQYIDGKTGQRRYTDIGNDIVIKVDSRGNPALVDPDLLLPVLPKSLADNKALVDLTKQYADAGDKAEIGIKDFEKQIKQMKEGRASFWSKSVALFMQDEGCAKTLCVFLGAVDPTGAATPECEKDLKKKNWSEKTTDELYQKLSLTKVVDRSPAIPSTHDAKFKEATVPTPIGAEPGMNTDPSSHNTSPFKPKSKSSGDAGKP